MKFIKLGNTDLNISQVGIGGMSFGSAGWMVGLDKASEIIRKAMDMGINYIDTANVYSNGESESIIGKTIEGIREDLVVSTKVGGKASDKHYGFSRKEFEYQLKQSLKRLGTNYVDIYYLHTWFDSLNPHEIIDILGNMVHDGRIRYYGLSNVAGYQLTAIDTIALERNLERPQIVQNHHNAIYREDERDVIPYSRLKSITYSPFSPLAAGFLSGKYEKGKEPDTVRAKEYAVMKKRYFGENDFEILNSVKEVAHQLDTTNSAVSLAYLLRKNFLPVVGVSNPKHLDDVERAFELNLKNEHMEKIEENYLPHVVVRGTAGY